MNPIVLSGGQIDLLEELGWTQLEYPQSEPMTLKFASQQEVLS